MISRSNHSCGFYGTNRALASKRPLSYQWLLSKVLDPNKFLAILTIGAVILGCLFRISFLIYYGFEAPYQFGGLYMEFAREIYANGYKIPAIIPHYTQGGLPFAYPPVPFMVEAFLVYDVGVSPFIFSNGFPVLTSLFSLLLFSFLVWRLPYDYSFRCFSIILYSISFVTFHEQIEGAGLAESFGTFSIILFSYCSHLLIGDPLKFRYWLFWAISASVCVVTSPGSAYACLVISLISLILIFLGNPDNEKKPMLSFAMTSFLIGVSVTAFYWLPVLRNHGIGLVVSSFFSQHGAVRNFFEVHIRELVRFDYMGGTGALVLFSFMGILLSLFERRLLLPFLFFAVAFIPRESAWLLPIIGVLSASYFLSRVFETYLRIQWSAYFRLITVLILAGISLQTAYAVGDKILEDKKDQMTSQEITELQTLRSAIPKDSNIVMLAKKISLSGRRFYFNERSSMLLMEPSFLQMKPLRLRASMQT